MSILSRAPGGDPVTPSERDLVVFAASLASIVVGCAAVAWAGWQLLRAGVRS